MTKQPYTAREIDSIVTSFREHVDDKYNAIRALFTEHKEDDDRNFREVKGTIIQLTKEVKKTNGKVRSLELWRSYILGGLSIISLLVIPLLIYVFQTTT